MDSNTEESSKAEEETWQVANLKKLTNQNKTTHLQPSSGSNASRTIAKEINTEWNRHHVNKIQNYVVKNVKCFVILRGCSGSGKSTLAKYGLSLLLHLCSLFFIKFFPCNFETKVRSSLTA
jgi:hypothetical protein